MYRPKIDKDMILSARINTCSYIGGPQEYRVEWENFDDEEFWVPISYFFESGTLLEVDVFWTRATADITPMTIAATSGLVGWRHKLFAIDDAQRKERAWSYAQYKLTYHHSERRRPPPRLIKENPRATIGVLPASPARRMFLMAILQTEIRRSLLKKKAQDSVDLMNSLTVAT
ncbi:hypothetical protein FB451DRAFT_1402533 [Mycena latifolia]|nr:hypothetical protein FB451DRAFT_1402533 [Mycena latifolia]